MKFSLYLIENLSHLVFEYYFWILPKNSNITRSKKTFPLEHNWKNSSKYFEKNYSKSLYACSPNKLLVIELIMNLLFTPISDKKISQLQISKMIPA